MPCCRLQRSDPAKRQMLSIKPLVLYTVHISIVPFNARCCQTNKFNNTYTYSLCREWACMCISHTSPYLISCTVSVQSRTDLVSVQVFTSQRHTSPQGYLYQKEMEVSLAWWEKKHYLHHLLGYFRSFVRFADIEFLTCITSYYVCTILLFLHRSFVMLNYYCFWRVLMQIVIRIIHLHRTLCTLLHI